MKSEETEIRKGAEKVVEGVKEKTGQDFEQLAKQVMEKGRLPKDAWGYSDAMVEGIYGQAYRLYNTGKYKDAIQLFRVLIMFNSTEPKYVMGMAACFHMMKAYKQAAQTYALCAVLDPETPIPYFHASDCHLAENDKISAIVALKMAIERAGEKPEFATLKDRAELTMNKLEKELDLKKEKEAEK